MKSLTTSQKTLEDAIQYSKVPWDSSIFAGQEEIVTTKMLGLYQLSQDVLKSCKNSIDLGINILYDLERQLKKMDRLNQQVDMMRADLVQAQKFLAMKDYQVCLLLCSNVDRSTKHMDKIMYDKLYEADEEVALAEALHKRFGVAQGVKFNEGIGQVLEMLKKIHPFIAQHVYNNIKVALEATQVTKNICLGIAMELNLQITQMKPIAKNIEQMIEETKRCNEINIEEHLEA